MKRALFSMWLMLLPLTGFAAADSTIHGLPTRATPAGSDYTVVDYQSGLAWYNGKISLYSLRDYIGGTSGYPTTNMYVTYMDVDYITNTTSWTTNLYATTEYVTNLYSTTEYVTNLYATTEYVTNLFATYETNLYSYTTNLYATTEYVTNLYSTYLTNNYEYTTNLYATTEYVTNLYNDYFTNNYSYVTNLYATTEIVTNLYVDYFTNNYSYITNLYNSYFTNNYSYITNLFVTNITAQKLTVIENITYQASTPFTNAWAGPTNTIPLHIADQNYLALTPCEITGFTSKSNTVSQHVLLRVINNNSGSNITLYVPAEWRTGDYASSYTISNNALGVISIEYTPALGGMSNAVFRDFN